MKRSFTFFVGRALASAGKLAPATAGALLLVVGMGAAEPSAAATGRGSGPAEGKGAPGAESVPERLEPCAERFEQLRDRLGSADTVVATLPDPLDSHFGRELDVLLAAISRSLGRLGYVRDVHCLPWSTGPEASGEAQAHRSEPGALLFRSDGGVLAVLLVGETPVTGVQTRALRRALDLARREFASMSAAGDGSGGEKARGEEGGAPRRGPEEVKLLGPTFSGSADSINLVLSAWRRDLLAAWDEEPGTACSPSDPAEPRLTLRMRSGSATVDGLGEILTAGLDGDPRFSVEEFRSLTATNLELMSCVWNRLVPKRLGLETQLPEELTADLERGRVCATDPEKPDADNRRVAILVESSAYGRDFEEMGFYVVPFPMHIWRLRELYERRQEVGAAPGARERSPESTLELELDRRPRGLPTFGSEATLASQEMVLNGILEDLARRRFEVVGVVASDVMDKRFLTERIQAVAPGSRIVTFEGDVLFARPRKAVAPAGVLVASSYPVAWPDRYADGADDQDPGDAPEVAAEETAEGACAEGLAEETANLRFPLDAAHGVYYAVRDLVCGESGAPPQSVWLSVTGKGALHTVEEVPLEGSWSAGRRPGARPGPATAGAAASGPRGAVPEARLPRGWWFLVSLMTVTFLFGLVHVARCLWPVRSGGDGDPPQGEDDPGPRRLFNLVPVELVRPPRWGQCRELSTAVDRVLHALAVLIPVLVGVPYLILSVPAIEGWLGGPGDQEGILSGLLAGWATVPRLVVVVLGLITLYLLVGLGVRTLFDVTEVAGAGGKGSEGWRRRTPEAAGVVVPFALTALLIAGAVKFGQTWVSQGWEGGAGLLLTRRSFALSSGASPLLPPLLFGGVLLGWIVLSLFRHRVRRAIPTSNEIADLAGEGFPGELRRRVTRLRRSIDPGSLWQRSGLLWTLLLAAPVAYLILFYEGLSRPPLRSIEGIAYDWSTSALFLLSLVVTVGAGISLLRGWTALRRLLEWAQVTASVEDRGSIEQIRDAYGEAASSQRLADERRRKALAALDDALETASGDPVAKELGEKLQAIEEKHGEDPAGRWVTIASWRSEHSAAIEAASEDSPLAAVAGRAHDFFVWSVVRFLRDSFLQLLQLMGFMTVGLLVILVGVTVYPFEPQRVLVVYASSLMALGATLSVFVLVQAQANKLLGALEGQETAPWKQLVGRLGVYAGLPAVSLLASRFPELRQILVDWVAPLFKAFQ